MLSGLISTSMTVRRTLLSMGRQRGLISASMIARQTLVLMARQRRDWDLPFQARYTADFPAYDLTLCLDDFAERHLFEAADTLMNMNTTLSVPHPSLQNLHFWADEASFEHYDGIELRVLRSYSAVYDKMHYVFDAQLKPSHPLAQAA